jgi:hypothetical protein
MFLKGFLLMIKKIFIVILSVYLIACAEKSVHTQMIPVIESKYNIQKGSSFYESVDQVIVSGGSATNPMWLSEVDDIEFQKALQMSLKNASIFSWENGKYIVEAHLINLEQPLIGFTLEVTSNIKYNISDKKTNKSIYNKEIKAIGSASPSDAFVASERLKIANERSVQENIKQFILDISKK